MKETSEWTQKLFILFTSSADTEPTEKGEIIELGEVYKSEFVPSPLVLKFIILPPF